MQCTQCFRPYFYSCLLIHCGLLCRSLSVNLHLQPVVQHSETVWTLRPHSITLMQICTNPEFSTVTVLFCLPYGLEHTHKDLGYQHALSVQWSKGIQAVMRGTGLGYRDINIEYLKPIYHRTDRAETKIRKKNRQLISFTFCFPLEGGAGLSRCLREQGIYTYGTVDTHCPYILQQKVKLQFVVG